MIVIFIFFIFIFIFIFMADVVFGDASVPAADVRYNIYIYIYR